MPVNENASYCKRIAYTLARLILEVRFWFEMCIIKSLRYLDKQDGVFVKMRSMYNVHVYVRCHSQTKATTVRRSRYSFVPKITQ